MSLFPANAPKPGAPGWQDFRGALLAEWDQIYDDYKARSAGSEHMLCLGCGEDPDLCDCVGAGWRHPRSNP